MAKYTLFGKEVTKEEFDRKVYKGIDGTIVLNEPFFLDEVVEIPYWFKSSAKKMEEKESLEKLRNNILNFKSYNSIEDITKIMLAEDEKELLEHLKNTSHTGGTVFEKVQDSTIPNKNIDPFYVIDIKNIKSVEMPLIDFNIQDPLEAYNAITGHSTRHKASKDLEEKVKESQETYGTKIDLPEFPNNYLTYLVNMYNGDFNRPDKFTVEDLPKFGKKEIEGKLDYSEINFNLLDLMAKRFMDNKVKYPKGNTLKEIDQDEILWAAFRHIRKMIKPIEADTETYKDHLAAVATNMSIILDQIERK